MTLVNADTGEAVMVGIGAWNGNTHPAAERYPMMSDDEILDLADDIAANGLADPLTLDEEGNLIDGRNRMKACGLVGVEMVFEIYTGSDVAGFVISKNEHRRHLSDEARIALRRTRAAELAEQGMSTRAIAKELGVSHPTVIADMQVVSGLPPASDPAPAEPEPTKVVGTDGKQHPAKKRPVWTVEDATVFLDRYHNLRSADDRMALAADYGLSVKSLPSTASTCRKAIADVSPQRMTKSEKVDRIRELAGSGATSKQIASEADLDERTVRTYAAEAGITITADKVLGKAWRLDANRVVQAIVDRVLFDINEDSALAAVRFSDLDHAQIPGWICSLEDSIKSLTTLKKRLSKEQIQHG